MPNLDGDDIGAVGGGAVGGGAVVGRVVSGGAAVGGAVDGGTVGGGRLQLRGEGILWGSTVGEKRNWLSAHARGEVSVSLQAITCYSLTAYYLPPIVRYLLLATVRSPTPRSNNSPTHHSLPAAHHLPFATHYLP